MSYQEMVKTLESSFEKNVQKIRRKKMFGDSGEKLILPVLSGQTGIGKTSAAKEFAKIKNYTMVNIDCSLEETDVFIAKLNNVVQSIVSQKIKGAIFLLDNINEATEKYLEIIKQYQKNYLNTFMIMKIPESNKSIHDLDSKKINIIYDTLPETLMLVGEQRSN